MFTIGYSKADGSGRFGYMKRLCRLFLVSIAGFCLLATPASGAVTLVYFQATAQPGRVILEWQTASELDNQGFFVNRSLAQFTGYSRISPFIPAQGDPLIGATYRYTDTNVINGTLYWYKLESIDNLSNAAFYDPPVSVIPGSAFTATPTTTSTSQVINTPTNTATPTRTVTPTRTATSSATRTPTRTQPAATATRPPAQSLSNPYPAPFQFNSNPALNAPTPVPTNATPAESAATPAAEALPLSFTPTPTLIPLPAITMQFPSGAGLGSAVPTPPSVKPASFSSWLSWLTPTRVLFMIFILFVWLFLAGWFYSSIRRVES